METAPGIILTVGKQDISFLVNVCYDEVGRLTNATLGVTALQCIKLCSICQYKKGGIASLQTVEKAQQKLGFFTYL